MKKLKYRMNANAANSGTTSERAARFHGQGESFPIPIHATVLHEDGAEMIHFRKGAARHSTSAFCADHTHNS